MTDLSLFRVYWDPADINRIPGHKYEGYPHAWYAPPPLRPWEIPIKDQVRDEAGHRCIRCLHPYTKRDGEWSPCDDSCAHQGPLRILHGGGGQGLEPETWRHVNAYARNPDYVQIGVDVVIQAQWRILTVHHLNGVKADCRWFNLVSLCQRCHLVIQAKVHMQRRWTREHSEWFRPYVAGFYAWDRLGEDLTRDETMARLEELLALEDRQMELRDEV